MIELENLFIIGDTHFNFSDKPSKSNKYKTLCEQSEARIAKWDDMINHWNSVIINGDFIDFEYLVHEKTDEEIIEHTKSIIDRLPGTLYLILGNHDRPFVKYYEGLDITIIPYPMVIDDFYIVSHEPMLIPEGSPYVNIHAHVHRSPMYNDSSPVSYCTSANRDNMDEEPMHFLNIKSDISKKYYGG